MGKSADPLWDFFGRSARRLFDGKEFVVVHGQLDRFPAWTRSGPLESVRALTAEYKGRLEVAQGRTCAPIAGQEFVGRGGQVRVQGVRADALLQLGLTVFFADIETTVPESAAFLRGLEAALGVDRCATVGIFANAPGSGLPWHHDSHDQLLIQLAGSKVFAHVPERPLEHPGIPFSPTSIVHPDFPAVFAGGFLDTPEAIQSRGVTTTVLEPGSCLFLPAGTFHRTVDQPEAALSMAVAVRPPSRLDLLVAALRHGALASAKWRAPAYGFFPESSEGDRAAEPLVLPEDLAALSGKLQQLTELDLASTWLARERDKASGGSRRPRFSRYLRVPSTELDWEAAEGDFITCVVRPIELTLPSRLGLAAVARPIVDDVLQRTRAFTVEDVCRKFPDFDEEEVADLLDQLFKVGLLRAVPFAGWSDL